MVLVVVAVVMVVRRREDNAIMAIVESRDCICTKEAMVWYDGWFDYAKVFSKVFIRREWINRQGGGWMLFYNIQSVSS